MTQTSGDCRPLTTGLPSANFKHPSQGSLEYHWTPESFLILGWLRDKVLGENDGDSDRMVPQMQCLKIFISTAFDLRKNTGQFCLK